MTDDESSESIEQLESALSDFFRMHGGEGGPESEMRCNSVTKA